MSLSETNVSDALAEAIEAMPNLIELELSHTKFTDEGIIQLSKSAKALFLDLDNTAITNNGVAALKNQNALLSLSLISTRVTGHCLETVKKLPRLKSINLSVRDKETREAVEHFTKIRPDCRVYTVSETNYPFVVYFIVLIILILAGLTLK